MRFARCQPARLRLGDSIFALSLAIAGICGHPMDAGAAETTIPVGSTAKAFLTNHCIDCHGTEEPEAGVNLSTLDPAVLNGDNAPTWHKVIEVLKFGQMPPAEETQPSPKEVDAFTSTMLVRLADAGHESDIEHRLQQPTYANLLSHEKLFDGTQKGPAFSPPRLWRLHPQAYENILTGFGRELQVGGPLSKPFTTGDDKGHISNYAALMQADSATLGQLMLNCRQIAQMQTVGFKKMEKDRKTNEMVERILRRAPESFDAIIQSDQPATDEQITAAVREEFSLILSRLPNDEEATAYDDLLRRAIEVGGKERGLQTLAMAVLLRPEAIYRMEVGLGEQDDLGRRMLSPHELAYAIAYALTDTSPDKLLLGPTIRNNRLQPPSLIDLANEGKLSTREDVKRVVLQMWDEERIEKPRVLRFFREFFGYHGAATVFKGDRAGKEFNAKNLVKDADQLVMHFVKEDQEVLKQLLTTKKFFVSWPGSLSEYERRIEYITKRIKPGDTKNRNYHYFIERPKSGLRSMPQANPTWRTTVRFYNLDEKTWNYPVEQPFALPEGQRIGILTHPAWLAAWSGNFDNDPIRRGKWIREHLLAGSVPDVPITVDASVPEDPHKTLRQRLQKTREAYCWKCHQKMEPLGLPFETYDDFGQFRAAEGLGETRALRKPKNTAPVVTSGQIVNSGDPSIDGEVEDVHQLMHRLAGSDRVRQSFVRHAFRYWMGRNEMLTDSPTLIAADKAYVEEGGSFKALVVSLLTSDSFVYRK